MEPGPSTCTRTGDGRTRAPTTARKGLARGRSLVAFEKCQPASLSSPTTIAHAQQDQRDVIRPHFLCTGGGGGFFVSRRSGFGKVQRVQMLRGRRPVRHADHKGFSYRREEVTP